MRSTRAHVTADITENDASRYTQISYITYPPATRCTALFDVVCDAISHTTV